MLTFSSEQMLAFEADVWQRYIEELTARFADEFPVVRASLGPDRFLRAILENANRAVDEFGIVEDEDIADYVRFCFRFGSGFHDEAAMPWAGNILRDQTFILKTEMSGFLASELLAYAGDTIRPAGAVLPVEAMGRYAQYLKTSDIGRAGGENTITLFERVWPEKAEVVSYEQLRDLIRETREIADGYGIGHEGLQRRFSLMAFVLGMRFDIDPVHDWAAVILRDPQGAGAADATGMMHLLEAAVQEHVLHPWLATDPATNSAKEGQA